MRIALLFSLVACSAAAACRDSAAPASATLPVPSSYRLVSVDGKALPVVVSGPSNVPVALVRDSVRFTHMSGTISLPSPAGMGYCSAWVTVPAPNADTGSYSEIGSVEPWGRDYRTLGVGTSATSGIVTLRDEASQAAARLDVTTFVTSEYGIHALHYERLPDSGLEPSPGPCQ